MNAPLQLLDVHDGNAPAWWPLAPGWWLLLAGIVVIAMLATWLRARKRRRHAAALRLFDGEVDRANTPSQQVAAMSGLLRRAARRKHAHADTLAGDAWLRLLDEGMPQPVFSAGAGALLRDGGFRDDVTEHEAWALRIIARERYLRWMRDA